MRNTSEIHRRIGVLIATLPLLVAGGCMKSETPADASSGGVPVNLVASFSRTAGGFSLQKSLDGHDGHNVDSLRIDSAAVVVEKIRFLPNADSVAMDPMGEDDHEGRDDDATLVFKGPFVIRVRDSLAIDFASQILPAGKYNGITFVIHRLMVGEHHEDSDEHNHGRIITSDSSIIGSSVVVWGAVWKNGLWVPFKLDIDLEAEFMIKGNFVVQEATGNVNIALNFNLALLFRDPMTGMFLDPTDPSSHTRELVARAVRMVFGHGRGGHDRDDDGHPDD